MSMCSTYGRQFELNIGVKPLKVATMPKHVVA